MGRKKTALPLGMEQALDRALDAAMRVQRPAVLAYLDRLRQRDPHATPAEIIDQLEHRYRATVVGIGGASGAAAAIPGAGTATALLSGTAELVAFVSATAMYVLAVAELHGLPVSDPDLRRALVIAVLLGESAVPAISDAAAQSPHWAQVLAHKRSRGQVGGLNSHIGNALLVRFGARQGALLLGRALPMGIGAGVGAAGNAALARAAVRSARRAFGAPPATFPARVVDVRPLP